jgi:hypothetical protein
MPAPKRQVHCSIYLVGLASTRGPSHNRHNSNKRLHNNSSNHLNTRPISNKQTVLRIAGLFRHLLASLAARMGQVDPALDLRACLPCKGTHLLWDTPHKALVACRLPRRSHRSNLAILALQEDRQMDQTDHFLETSHRHHSLG